MDGRESSLSLQGEAYPRPLSAGRKSRNKYKVISRTSSVDETLFGSHRDMRNEGRRVSADKGQAGDRKTNGHKRMSSPKIKTSLTSTPSARSDSRVTKKASPSYVDETLFGEKLSMPTFDPPWAEEKDAVPREPPLVWSPPVQGSLSDTPRSRPSSAQDQRSSSRMNNLRSSTSMGSRPNSARSCEGRHPIVKPPWR